MTPLDKQKGKEQDEVMIEVDSRGPKKVLPIGHVVNRSGIEFQWIQGVGEARMQVIQGDWLLKTRQEFRRSLERKALPEATAALPKVGIEGAALSPADAHSLLERAQHGLVPHSPANDHLVDRVNAATSHALVPA